MQVGTDFSSDGACHDLMKGELSETRPLAITHTTGRWAIYCVRGHWVVLLHCSVQALAQHLDAGVPLALPPPPAAY